MALYLSSRKKLLGLLWGGLSLTSAFLIFASGARGALLASGAGLLLFFILDRGKSHLRKILLLLLAGLIFLSGSLLLEGVRSGVSRSWEKVAMVSSFREGSVGARFLWWRVSLEMIRAHPVGGTGTGTFREAYPLFQRKFFQDSSSAPWVPRVRAAWKENYNATVEAPHNEYLHIAAEMGLPGFLLFAAFASLLLLGQVRRRSGSPPSWKNGCTASCLAILVASFFGFPLHLPSTGVPFFLMAGLLNYHEVEPVEPGEVKKRGDLLFGILSVLIACLALLQLIHQGKVFESGRHLYQAVGYHLSGKIDRALQDLAQAKRLNPQDPEIDYWLGLSHLSAGRLHSAKEFLERAKSCFNSPRLYLTLGAIGADLQEVSAAESLYREGIATYPGLAPLHARLGALYAHEGRFPEALRELEQAREMDPFYAETHHFLGHLFYRWGRPREAHRSLKYFLQLASPSDPRRRLDLDLMRKIE
jgi:tetratricopeptide (TPR) repeat protein